MSPADVGRWLVSIGKSEYKTLFEENDIAGEFLVDLSDGDLKELGVRSFGHRKEIGRAIDGLPGSFDV